MVKRAYFQSEELAEDFAAKLRAMNYKVGIAERYFALEAQTLKPYRNYREHPGGVKVTWHR